MPLPFGTALLFLFVGEKLLEAWLFVRLTEELLERARFLIHLGFQLLQLFKLMDEEIDSAGLFFQFAISIDKKSISDLFPPLQNGLFRKSLFLLFDDAPRLRQHGLEVEERSLGQFFVAAEITLGFASLLLVVFDFAFEVLFKFVRRVERIERMAQNFHIIGGDALALFFLLLELAGVQMDAPRAGYLLHSALNLESAFLEVFGHFALQAA